tara:strand:- start:15 stop:179 length:165 start_codon:yes stop_codon:yes gene_type:complete
MTTMDKEKFIGLIKELVKEKVTRQSALLDSPRLRKLDKILSERLHKLFYKKSEK